MSTMQITQRKYAWRPDTPDHRDQEFKYNASRKAIPVIVPPLCAGLKVENQGNLGSCTGNASTTALEYMLKFGDKEVQLSRIMAYYNARLIEGTVNQDAGACIRNVIKGLIKTGVCHEPTWPYKVSKFKQRPSDKAYTEASDTRKLVTNAGLVYQRITSLNALLQAIGTGTPVIFGFTVTQSFENLFDKYLLPLPRKDEASLGGHAVVADGYDTIKKFVWVRNSWGRDWGLEGYFKMPFAWFTDPRRLVDDMWTIRKAKS